MNCVQGYAGQVIVAHALQRLPLDQLWRPVTLSVNESPLNFLVAQRKASPKNEALRSVRCGYRAGRRRGSSSYVIAPG